jgi:hypothetical protein
MSLDCSDTRLKVDRDIVRQGRPSGCFGGENQIGGAVT